MGLRGLRGSPLSEQGPKLTASDENGLAIFGDTPWLLSGDGATLLIGGPRDNNLVGAAWAFAAPRPPSASITSPRLSRYLTRSASQSRPASVAPRAPQEPRAVLVQGQQQLDTPRASSTPRKPSGPTPTRSPRPARIARKQTRRTSTYTVAAAPSTQISSPASRGFDTHAVKSSTPSTAGGRGRTRAGAVVVHGDRPDGEPRSTPAASRTTHPKGHPQSPSDGQRATSTVTYTVVLPNNRFAIREPCTRGSTGLVRFKVVFPGPGSADVMETAWLDNFAHTATLLAPARAGSCSPESA